MSNEKQKKEKKPKGAAFTHKLEEKRLKPSVLARAMRVDGQHVNNWKNRGVAVQYAVAVAQYLECEPHEISEIKGTYEINKPNTVDEKKKQLIEEMKTLIDSLDNEDQLNKLQQTLHFGKRIALDQPE